MLGNVTQMGSSPNLMIAFVYVFYYYYILVSMNNSTHGNFKKLFTQVSGEPFMAIQRFLERHRPVSIATTIGKLYNGHYTVTPVSVGTR